jgi:hypothetical protein
MRTGSRPRLAPLSVRPSNGGSPSVAHSVRDLQAQLCLPYAKHLGEQAAAQSPFDFLSLVCVLGLRRFRGRLGETTASGFGSRYRKLVYFFL